LGDFVMPERRRQAIWLLPLAAAVILLLGLTTYHRNQVYHTALALWEDTVAKVPTNYAAWDNLGYTYRLMGDLERALAALNRGIATRDDYADIYGERARTYEAMHKLPEAVQDYNRALELNSGLRSARYGRAALLLRLKRYAEAEDDLNTLLEIQDYAAGMYYFLRAQARMRLGRFDAAKSDLDAVIARHPEARKQVEQMLTVLYRLRQQNNRP
jgi:tetratricopeptide (TPR) repeat protein